MLHTEKTVKSETVPNMMCQRSILANTTLPSDIPEDILCIFQDFPGPLIKVKVRFIYIAPQLPHMTPQQHSRHK